MALTPGDGGGSGFNVDLAGLNDVATQVRTDNKNNLGMQYDPVKNQFGDGVRFGTRSPSSAVLAAKQMYQRSLIQAIDTLNGYMEAAEVLASAAEAVATRYGQADALSAAQSAEVKTALSDALAKVRAAQAAQQQPAAGGRNMAI